MKNASATKIISNIFHIILRGFFCDEAATIEGLFTEAALENNDTEYLAGWNLVFLHDDRETNKKEIKIGYRRSDEEYGLCDVEIGQIAFDIECVLLAVKAKMAA